MRGAAMVRKWMPDGTARHGQGTGPRPAAAAFPGPAPPTTCRFGHRHVGLCGPFSSRLCRQLLEGTPGTLGRRPRAERSVTPPALLTNQQRRRPWWFWVRAPLFFWTEALGWPQRWPAQALSPMASELQHHSRLPGRLHPGRDPAGGQHWARARALRAGLLASRTGKPARNLPPPSLPELLTGDHRGRGRAPDPTLSRDKHVV